MSCENEWSATWELNFSCNFSQYLSMESSTQKLPIYIDQTLITALGLGVATEPHFSLPKFLLYRFLFSVPNFSGTPSGIIFGTSIFWYHFRYHPKQWKIPGESSVPVPNSREFSGTGSKFLWLSNFTGTGLYLAMFESINMDK